MLTQNEPKVKLYVTLPSYCKEFPKTLPLYSNGFPKSLSIDEIQQAINDSFATEGRYVVKKYFDKKSPSYPKNMAFFIFGIDLEGQLASGTITTREQLGDFPYKYHDKVFVIKKYQGNGIGPQMVELANEVDNGKKLVMAGVEIKIPSVMRTSFQRAHETYSEISDIWVQEGDFYTHGFKFRNKETKEDLFPDASWKFKELAKHVAKKPKTVLPLDQLAV